MRPWLGWVCALALVGCCSDPWEAFPEATPPDESYQTGTAHGYDVYVWKDLGGQRVVVSLWTGEMTCAEPTREIGPMGQPTPLEKQVEDDERRPLSQSRLWRPPPD